MSDEGDRWLLLERLFHAALARPPEERQQFLARECSADPPMLLEVQRLLDADRSAQSRIERIVAGGAARAAAAFGPMPGAHFGPYTLVRELGGGGMGAVWLAELRDDTAAPPVAIKLLKPGIASPGALHRFRAEQSILATLTHPNIARLMDGGVTDDDQPFFVMEFIAGQPIDLWCSEHGLGVDQRIDLFLRICAPVQFAHARLIVHRDIKPGNILVTADGTPKLLDFGIAKILDPEAAFVPETAPGVRLMTPHYASPEQIRGSPVSPATDVYALGVVLYELLTERLPYDLPGTQPQAIAAAILAQNPKPPSTNVSSPGLQRRLAGDLDTIILTALQKEPRRRFRSVELFAASLRLHRGGRPTLVGERPRPH